MDYGGASQRGIGMMGSLAGAAGSAQLLSIFEAFLAIANDPKGWCARVAEFRKLLEADQRILAETKARAEGTS
jgi:hypothetical protein